ncbi:hypothetical protein [Akkermansia muciniphila]|uniref:hypothetical protein n=1 Tax=Akkermansia muciniphila TaxID=239935 RepID=UPI0027D2AECB|nr:hypothetical protein [Akkermansia muciniphila]MCI9265648.1 hypothetical protein [Akkermansia muciniphila]WMB17225.1 hypothetical protein O4G21_10025 [Akkermansia muciniphila]
MGSTSVGTNSAGTALGDHIKVGNSCVSVGSWSNTDHCHMGIALGYQSNTSNESEKHHTATAYSFCAGMGSRIEGAFCIGIGRGGMWKTVAGTASCLAAIPGRKCPAAL